MRRFIWLTFLMASFSTAVSVIYLIRETEEPPSVRLKPVAPIVPSLCLRAWDKETCITP